MPDIDRALSRLALERGGPRDLAAIRAGLIQARQISHQLGAGPKLLEIPMGLLGHDPLIELLLQAIACEPPYWCGMAAILRPVLIKNWTAPANCETRGEVLWPQCRPILCKQTGIQSLKIKHNNVLGYFIETTATHAERMFAPPLSETFIHRQTTANQVRFTTVALSEIETKILNAGNHALELGEEAFRGFATSRAGTGWSDRSRSAQGWPRLMSPMDLESWPLPKTGSQSWMTVGHLW